MQCEGSEQALRAMDDLCSGGGEAVVKIRVPVAPDGGQEGDQDPHCLDPFHDAMLAKRLHFTRIYGSKTELRAVVSSQRGLQALRGQFAELLGRAIAEGLQVDVERPTEYMGV